MAQDHGPLGIAGIVRRIAQRQKAKRPIPATDEDILHDVYVELLSKKGFDPQRGGLGAYAGQIAYRKTVLAGTRKDALRGPVRVDEGAGHYLSCRCPRPDECVERAEIIGMVQTQWRSLVHHLTHQGRKFELRCLSAVVRAGGNHTIAASRLSEALGHAVSRGVVSKTMRRIRRYGPAREMFRLYGQLIN